MTKKRLIATAFLLGVQVMFSGCDNTELEQNWGKAKTGHKIVEVVGKTVIAAGIVPEDTAASLKAANGVVKTVGTAAEETYKTVKTSKKQDADTALNNKITGD